MSTITAYVGTLGLRPTGQRGPLEVLSQVRAFFVAIREGRDAAHRYREMTARGVSHEEAVKRLFAQSYNSR
jgi:hypothetical protein